MTIKKVIIKNRVLLSSCIYVSLQVEINNDQDLVMSGYDTGNKVKEIWGDSDYEYWIIVKKKNKDQLLLKLITDQFDNEIDFKAYLDNNNIPYEFMNWI